MRPYFFLIMDIKHLLPIAAIASTVFLGSSCSDVSNDTPIQGAIPTIPAESPAASPSSHSQSHPKDSQEPHSAGHSYDSHAHQSLEVSANQPIPAVDLIVHEDAVMGWNLEIQVSNFRFAPENVNQESKTYEGHAHLYINGEKIGRLYSPWRHVASLEPGENKLKVTLNANGHESLSFQGKEISDTESIQVPISE